MDVWHGEDVLRFYGYGMGEVSIVGQALDGLKRISSVVERNVEISQNSEQASVSMANETGSLLKMIEQ